MLSYKVTPPAIPECIHRPRLLASAVTSPVVVLTAPAGYGKTCLAAQIAAATGGPTAWFTADELDRDRASVVGHLLAAFGAAWADLAPVPAWSPDDGASLPLLASTLEIIAGPGGLVIDDAHLLPADVLDAIVRTAAATLAPDCRLVVRTRGAVPGELLCAEAARRAVTIDATALAFDVGECARASGSGAADSLRDRTGGWPLAVALVGRVPGPRPVHLSGLATIALSDLDDAQRDLLVTLVHLPRFPDQLLTRVGEQAAGIGTFARLHPELFGHGTGWWSPREWLRDALAPTPPDPALVDAVVAALVDLGETELAARLLTAGGRYEEAVPLVGRLASDGLGAGRVAWSLALIEEIPAALRPFELRLLAATAERLLGGPDALGGIAAESARLVDLVEEAGGHGAGALLHAEALLADHYRMAGDERALAVCERALGDALVAPADSLATRWSTHEAPAAAEMLRYYGFERLLSPDPATMEGGRALLAAAMQVLEHAGRPTISQRAWWQYFEVLTFRRRAADALVTVRHAAHRLAAADHISASTRLAELATVEFFAGEPTTGHSIELARELADRTGNRLSLAAVAAIEVALAVEAGSFGPDHARRFDATMAELVADPRLERFAPLIAAEFGIVLVRRGQLDAALGYLARAEQLLGSGSFAHAVSFRCARLRALLSVAEGLVDRGRAGLLELRAMAAAEARDGLVALVDADLAALAAPAAAADREATVPRLAVTVLAPELAVTIGGTPVPPPRGYPAKLLAVLIASGGIMTIDAAIEALWPGADPDVGRNRLHGVILRLRRGLGLPAGGPISCTEGVVRLARGEALEIDAWEFERLAGGPAADALAAVDRYTGAALGAQYAYDDTVEAYRQRLHRLFVRAAAAMLDAPPPECDAEYVASLAHRAWGAAPDDQDVCRAAAGALARQRRVAQARELIDGTAHAWIDLGLDGNALRVRTLQELGLPV